MSLTNKLTVQSIKRFTNKLESVSIDEKSIETLVKNIKEDNVEANGLDLFSNSWSLSDSFRITLIFNAMNFCYWAEEGRQKWSIEIKGEKLDGSIALFRLLEEGVLNNSLTLDWKGLTELRLEAFKDLFYGSNIEIPLLDYRYKNLILLAKSIVAKYNGDSDNLLKSTHFCAARMLKKLSTMEVFKDESAFHGERVYFLKRAQLQVKMFNDIRERFGYKQMCNLHILTAFADYKVPQILRHLGILNYSDKLANQIDSFTLIEKDSLWENEIRIATIVAVDQIRAALAKADIITTACQIDSLLWRRAASNKDPMKPYHRTYTAAY